MLNKYRGFRALDGGRGNQVKYLASVPRAEGHVRFNKSETISGSAGVLLAVS